jgi:two-component system sensor histidine kinase PilS (NtrC family)
MCFRVLFAVLMTGASILFQFSEHLSGEIPIFRFIYSLSGFILFISAVYAVLLQWKHYADHYLRMFACLQILNDTLVVSAIVYLTGGFSSIFNFLYLLVIIYSSFFLLTKGSLITAAVCSLQYALLVGLEYGGLLQPESIFDQGMMEPFALNLAAYKVLIITLACFSVSLLSSILAEQNRKTRKRLYAMTEHVKRVEQLAVVGEMAAALAHEIKNPLASLSGSIQLLKEDTQSQPDHSHLMHIALREAHRLSTLVGDFLQFARPKTGNMESIVLQQTLSDIIEMFKKHEICRERITICCQCLPEVTIRMDRTHFHQMIWNLLTNAAEAIEGEGRIDIKVKQVCYHRIAVEISDNGCGMTSEQLDSIFFPFYTTKSSGTGLGLSIVHRLLESYHYPLDVESQRGFGSTFTILFDSEV